jgi:hypothetical protein
VSTTCRRLLQPHRRPSMTSPLQINDGSWPSTRRSRRPAAARASARAAGGCRAWAKRLCRTRCRGGQPEEGRPRRRHSACLSRDSRGPTPRRRKLLARRRVILGAPGPVVRAPRARRRLSRRAHDRGDARGVDGGRDDRSAGYCAHSAKGSRTFGRRLSAPPRSVAMCETSAGRCATVWTTAGTAARHRRRAVGTHPALAAAWRTCRQRNRYATPTGWRSPYAVEREGAPDG